MAISVFDLFSIGIGPSSSHTVGPMRAARMFARRLKNEGLLAHTASIRAELFGSLGATGHGHGTPKAVLLGLEGESPRTVDVESADDRVAEIRASGRLNLLGMHEIDFDADEQLVLHRRKALPYHANGMTIFAYDHEGAPCWRRRTTPSAAASSWTRTRWARTGSFSTTPSSSTPSAPATNCCGSRGTPDCRSPR